MLLPPFLEDNPKIARICPLDCLKPLEQSNQQKLSLLNLLFGFPLPIIFALLLNEVNNTRARKLFQTASYMPYFISMVIVAGLVVSFVQTNGLVNKALEVEGVRMAILATQREEGVKLSLRAVEPDTVNDIAKQFGGGGHAQAAGVTMQMPMDKAVAAVLAAMKEKLG